jgi:hypothetical protein
VRLVGFSEFILYDSVQTCGTADQLGVSGCEFITPCSGSEVGVNGRACSVHWFCLAAFCTFRSRQDTLHREGGGIGEEENIELTPWSIPEYDQLVQRFPIRTFIGTIRSQALY